MRKEFIETDQLASPLTERERPGDHEPAVATKAIDESVSEEEAARQRTIGRRRLRGTSAARSGAPPSSA